MNVKRAIQAFVTGEKVRFDKFGSVCTVVGIITRKKRRFGARLGTEERKGYNTCFQLLDRNGGTTYEAFASDISELTPEVSFDFHEALGVKSDINIHKMFAFADGEDG